MVPVYVVIVQLEHTRMELFVKRAWLLNMHLSHDQPIVLHAHWVDTLQIE